MQNIIPRLAVLMGLSFSAFTYGGTPDVDEKAVVEAKTPFDKGRLELQSTTGAYFSVGENRTSLNCSSTSYRLGLMLNTPYGEGFIRGNFELMGQLFEGSVFDGPGNYLAGAAVVLRYNFVQPQSKWVPYFQIGAGAVYNDIYKDFDQRLIGQQWEYDLEASVGIRYFLNDRWAANFEGGFRHISNADNADRNVGLNSLGTSVGLGYHF